ncbi:hypothetical protein [Agrococcus sp. HG114]|uniref:hypothetical protein n=1 Tax=Agrococcus sp. HG114 TaxID=2969757 RepID=UPI00215B728B|nr:hypothetical protein [Agrococcus sp. HG114]MCR8670815.1 hypothetical protein [Agrococcus sp. HG114]
MTGLQHRARIGFAIGALPATLLALGLSLVVGLGIVAAITPELQGSAIGVVYGLMIGLPMVAAVLLARHGVRRHFSPWIAGSAVVVGSALVVALLFWLAQVNPAMVPVTALTGALVAAVAVAIAIWPRPRR